MNKTQQAHAAKLSEMPLLDLLDLCQKSINEKHQCLCLSCAAIVELRIRLAINGVRQVLKPKEVV